MVSPNPFWPWTVLQCMKIHFAILGLVLMQSPMSAQTVLTTYYMLPPTNGCDGLWAFGPASAVWQAPCTAPFLYVVEPIGCAEGAGIGQPFWISGDTVYSNLCSMPCGITIYDASGECVILCQLPGSMGSDEMANTTGPLQLEPNPLTIGTPLRIVAQENGPVEWSLIEPQGRVVDQGLMSSPTLVLNTAYLRAGMHLLHTRGPDGRKSIQRIIVQ